MKSNVWMNRRYQKIRRTSKVDNGNTFRSKYERRIATTLDKLGVAYEYEAHRLPYEVQEKRHYTPDFKLSNGIFIEAKGIFDAADRKKHLAFRKSNPTADVRFLFQRPGNKLTKAKGSMTYGEWCDKNNFKWAGGLSIPKEWINEIKRSD